MLNQELSEYGSALNFVDSGAEALDPIQDKPIRILVTDLKSPLNGRP